MSGRGIGARLAKAALIGIDPVAPVPAVVPFEYNPETLTRKIEPRNAGTSDADKAEVLRLGGPPKETITLAAEFDAANRLEDGDPLTVAMGVHPQLAALETLVYPSSASVIANLVLTQLGSIEIIPPAAPLVIFAWGPVRLLPVRIVTIAVTEEAFDHHLNPIRAKVDLTLQVLSTHDLPPSSLGHGLFMAHHAAKEALALTNIAVAAQTSGVLPTFP